MATYQVYQAGATTGVGYGNKEDLSDIITDISPSDTQFFSSLSERKAKAHKHEWTTDALATIAAHNKTVEGAAASDKTIAVKTRLFNYIQGQENSFKISTKQEAVAKVGPQSEVDYQATKAMKEIARDIEASMLGGVIAVGNASTASEMRGALNWLTTNITKQTNDTVDGTTGVVTIVDAAVDLAESTLQAMIASCYTQGGNPTKVLTGPVQKRKISAFASNGNYRTMVEQKKLMATVDVYVSDFGPLEIIPSRTITQLDDGSTGYGDSIVFVWDPEYWHKSTLIPLHKTELASTGPYRFFQLYVEHTLEANSQAASGRIVNLTNS